MNDRTGIFVLSALIVPAVIIWGQNFAVIRTGVDDIGVFTRAAMRFAVALALAPMIGLASGYLLFGKALSAMECPGCILVVTGVLFHLSGATRHGPPIRAPPDRPVS